MKEKEVLNIKLDPIDLPRMRDVIDLLAKWYRERVLEYPNTDTVDQTRILLEAWGRIE